LERDKRFTSLFLEVVMELVREWGGVAILLSVVAGLIGVNVWAVSLKSPWKLRNDWPTARHYVLVVIGGLFFIAVAAYSLGGVAERHLNIKFQAVFTAVAVTLIVLATKPHQVSLILLLCMVIEAFCFLYKPGMLTGQLIFLVALLVPLVGLAAQLPHVLMPLRPLRMRAIKKGSWDDVNVLVRPFYPLVAIPLWLVLLAGAAVLDAALRLTTRDLFGTLYYHNVMPATHWPISANDGTMTETLLYGEPPYSMGIFTTVVGFMTIGVIALWARYFNSKALLVLPLIGGAAGIAAGIVVTVLGGHQVLNGACVAGGVITGTGLAVWYSGFWRELITFRPDANAELAAAIRFH
jgi:hypothetical protein